MKNAINAHFPAAQFSIELESELSKTNFPKQGLYKCRLIYDTEIKLIEFHAYHPPVIQSLKILPTQIPSLPYKLTDRANYQAAFAQRGDCDDVLLVKNGLLTDTSYCNIALFDGVNWVTPKTPLIIGVNREQLLSENKIFGKDIFLSEIQQYSFISLFNALNEHKSILISIDKLYE
jgi:4-amino-4-deoxychorismate lyase